MRFVYCLFASTLMSCSTEAKTPEINNGRIVYTAWECSVYASMANKTEKAEKLFEKALNSGRAFIQQVEDKEIPEDYIRSNVPIGTTMIVFDGGPTADFILGRLYESVSSYAYDKVVKEDSNGRILDAGEWNTDKELKAILADNHFLKSNCDLLTN